ncbi:helix-turn-helix domain-containing protein [Streptomyces sp. NBC_01352]|uniref:helix-turn-helix domain-containing protein n=1 Tax=Streptomyces sp. NBC_01352 TaxID=2903834 RepID=UPI002E35950E|nr:helix-turn-helix transcriptional regulator [Streptomyces sp. NBC_01352]
MHQPPTTFFEVDGVAIREKRKQAGFEISELAEKAGISRRYLSHLENGTRTRMRPGKYAGLRAALDATDADLAPQRQPPERK